MPPSWQKNTIPASLAGARPQGLDQPYGRLAAAGDPASAQQQQADGQPNAERDRGHQHGLLIGRRGRCAPGRPLGGSRRARHPRPDRRSPGPYPGPHPARPWPAARDCRSHRRWFPSSGQCLAWRRLRFGRVTLRSPIRSRNRLQGETFRTDPVPARRRRTRAGLFGDHHRLRQHHMDQHLGLGVQGVALAGRGEDEVAGPEGEIVEPAGP